MHMSKVSSTVVSPQESKIQSKAFLAASSLLATAVATPVGPATCPAAPVQANFRYYGDFTCTKTGVAGGANFKEITLTAGTCQDATAFTVVGTFLVYINSAEARLINAPAGSSTYEVNVFPQAGCKGRSLISETIDNKQKPDCLSNTDRNTPAGGLSVKLSKLT